MLGKTNISVSRMCFGSLTIGPLQANLDVDEGARLIAEAFDAGINFIDTAEIYGTYPYIKKAIKHAKEDIIIASKSYAYSACDAQKSLDKVRKELDRDYIDIFLMHEQESRLTLQGHREALEFYLNAREKNLIKAVGVSTHNIEVVEAAACMPEIEVVHPIVNRRGIGIGDGSIDKMLEAVELCSNNGKGIYSMKPLGGGNLISEYEESMAFVVGLPFIHSIAIGIQSHDELEANICVINGKEIPPEVKRRLAVKNRRLHIEEWCRLCGECAARCSHGALDIDNGKIRVKMDKCVLCGYCASVCRDFCIKVI